MLELVSLYIMSLNKQLLAKSKAHMYHNKFDFDLCFPMTTIIIFRDAKGYHESYVILPAQGTTLRM